MMRPITYSWIGQCAAAPLVFLASAWILGVFHSYRRHWMSVDLFLLAVTAQELLMALQVFVFSLLSLVKPEWDGACAGLVWSFNATRALQLATITSLLADRALTCHWPYRYRFSVRRHQLRYHLAVIAAMAALLGVAALIARPQLPTSFPACATMPYLLHIRLALFLLAVYGALLLVGLISAAVVQTSRGCFNSEPSEMTQHITTNTTSSSSSSHRQPPSTSSLGSHGRPLQTCASTASSTSSSVGLGGLGLRAASSTADLLPSLPPPGNSSRPSILRSMSSSSPGGSDFRWSTCLSVAALSICVNHVPYLSLTVLGTFLPNWLPSWPVEPVVLWLSLAEGALLPLVLLFSDTTFRKAAGASCSSAPPNDKATLPRHPYRVEADGRPFRLYPKEEVKAFPLTNGSLFSSLLSLPVDHTSHYNYKKDVGLRMGISQTGLRALDIRKLSHGLTAERPFIERPYGAPYYCRDITDSMASLATTSNDNLYSTTKTSSVDSSLKEEHIYATLSETFGSMSSFGDGYTNDDNRCPSVTTVANDDFEFHDPRTSGCSGVEVHPMGRNPCIRQQSYSTSSFSSGGCVPSFGRRAREGSTLELNSARNHHVISRPPADLPPEAYTHATMFNKINDKIISRTSTDLVYEKNKQNLINEKIAPVHLSTQIGYNNYEFDSDTLEKKYYMQKHACDTLEKDSNEADFTKKGMVQNEDVSDGTLSRKHRISSLSMNDLDKFDKGREPKPEEQMMFMLPVKSESMLSLYRLYLAEDEHESSTSLHYSIELSKSENDLSVVTEEQESLSIGRSTEDIQTIPHEIYQKRRRPQSSASKVRRQHKIQRARGLSSKNKPNLITSHHIPHIPSRFPCKKISADNPADREVQVAIMDKCRRQNGIITIRDPSGLSVQELFSVLNRASATSSNSPSSRHRTEVLVPPSSEITTVSDISYQKMATNGHSRTRLSGQSEFKKIFVSEYL